MHFKMLPKEQQKKVYRDSGPGKNVVYFNSKAFPIILMW